MRGGGRDAWRTAALVSENKMSFDLIETTVANAILLRASYDHEPVDLNLIQDDQLIRNYGLTVRPNLTLSGLLQEPVGKYQFKMFLKSLNAHSKIDLMREIGEFKIRKKRDRLSKSKYIFSKFLAKAVGCPQNFEIAGGSSSNHAEESNSESKSQSKSHHSEHRQEVVEESSEKSKSERNSFPTLEEDHAFTRSRAESTNQLNNLPTSPMLQPSMANVSEEQIFVEISPLQPHDVPTLPEETDFASENLKTAEKKEDIYVEQFKEEHSDDEEYLQDAFLDLGVREEDIRGAYYRWKDAVKKNKIPSDLFDHILHTLQDQLENQDFQSFLESEHYRTYLQLKYYCENTKVGYSDFQIFRVLGKGAFGAVHAVRKLDTKKIYAMKEMEKQKVKFYTSEKMCITEKTVLQSLSSPFVLNLKYAFTNEESLFLVMDICQGGDLQYHLSESKDNRFEENRARLYAAELVLALEHIHSLDYVYRDLKPGNVLLDETGHVMLSDLGLVHKISSKKPLTSLAGTAGYWAPEVMMRKTQTKAIDWWSFGVFLFKCLTGHRPKCHCNKKEKEWCPFGTSDDHEQNAKAGNPIKFVLDLNIESDLSHDAKDLLSKLLDPSPSRRLGARGAEEVKNHSFFKSIDWDKLEHREIRPPFVPRKGEVHAATLGEIGEGDPNMSKYRKIVLDATDAEFYRKWDYKSIAAFQEELVWALKRNERVKRKQFKRNRRKYDEGKLQRGCCVLQ